MLTLYYASATFLQSWRIKKVCSKISEQLGQQTSVSFYTISPDQADGYDTALATSELCSNRNSAKVSEILWLKANQRGCSLRPIQTLKITPWVTFPETPNWLPFAHSPISEELLAKLTKDKPNLLHLLVEADIQPYLEGTYCAENVKVEDYGKLIAWKMDSHLAVLMETDIEHFTKLLISTFLQNNCLINDQLPLIRIESVQYEGEPQPFGLVSNHLRKSTRTSATLSIGDWKKHLENLRALSVLANQATEFEYSKNRTEGKTGAVKPDLIAHESKPEKEKGENVTPEKIKSPAMKAADMPRKMSDVSAPATSPKKTNPLDSKQKLPENDNELKKTEVKTVAALSDTNSKQKMKAKPTEIRKPGATVVDGRFRTTAVNEPQEKAIPPQTTLPTGSTSAAAVTPQDKSPSKSSELGNLSAVSAVQKQMSPVHASTPTTPVKPSNLSSKPSTPAKTPQKEDGKDTTFNETASISVNKDNARRPSLKRNKDSLNDSKPLNILVYSESATARESAIVTLRDILEPDMYTIYAMLPQQVEQKYWFDNTALLVVCGAVPVNYGEIFVDYFLRGGRVVSLCSDILHFVLPTYRTAEVREHELVQFSYDKWQKVKMMHHIFCYQPSPVKKNFSTDSEDSGQANVKKPQNLNFWRS